DQLAAMFFDTRRRAQVRLVCLHRLRVLDRFQPYHPTRGGREPYHYVLGPMGAAVVAAERGEDPDRAARRWKGERTLALGRTQRLAHLVGLNGIYASLVAHARRHPDTGLACWLTEAECAKWANAIVRPDAFGEWAEAGSSVEFFVEYDRGTETLARLAAKLTGYQRFESERAATAWVLFAFVSAGREAAARRALADATVPVATAVLNGGSLGPQDAVWLPVRATGPARLRLAALAHIPKPPEAARRAAEGGPRAWRFDRSRYDDKEEAPIDTT
ncbi:MAG: hypothetical protein QOF60_1944, partial [Actinomycetota bacterium]|nr:hypothetical protein [Actinomycetota bacterium]